MLSLCIQYIYVLHSMCWVCDKRMITCGIRQFIVVENTNDLG